MREPLKTQGDLKELLGTYYLGMAAKEKPIAWCTSVGPAELLRAFGYEVYFPENHGAMIGAKRPGAKNIPAASREGYSAEVCSYMTADIGAFLEGETPLQAYGFEGVPKPDLLVYNTSQCREVKEWFGFFARRFEAPLLGIHTPQNLDEITPELLAYLTKEWERLIEELERLSGRPLDRERFEEIASHSYAACKLWQEFLESNGRRPAPHTFFDHVILMAPVVVLRGTPQAVDFYRRLIDEVEAMPAPDVDERVRVYWDGMPIWGKNRHLSEFFQERAVSVVASTYGHSWTFDFEGGDPLPAMVRAYAEIFISRSESFKLEYLKEITRRFGADAVLFHDAKTCPHNTNTRFSLPGRLRKETGLPTLTFYGDLVDLRHFSEEEFALRMEALLEQLEGA